MRRLRAAIAGLCGVGALLPASASANQSGQPSWLLTSERQLLSHTFAGAMPLHVYYLGYRKKIAVIFEFRTVTICRLCSAPTNANRPRGKVIRVSFDRAAPHAMGDAIRFCEARGNIPPRSYCFKR